MGKPAKDSVNEVISKYISHLKSVGIVNGFVESFIDEVNIIKHGCAIKTIKTKECVAMQSIYLRA